MACLVRSDGFAVANDGARIAFSRFRSAKVGATRVALIHALAMDRTQWVDVIAAAGEDFEIVALDCRGHGSSDGQAESYSCEQFAGDVESVFDEIGWQDAIIAGCSMGGCVAQMFASRHADRTKGLLPIDTTMTYGPGARPAWRRRADEAIHSGMRSLIPFQLDRWFSAGFRKSNPAAVQRCVDVFLANDTEHYAKTCAMLADADLRHEVTKIRCPTTVVVGEFDYATPVSMAKDLANAISGARLTIVSDAKHFAPVEAPAAILSGLQDLAQRAHDPASS